MKTQTFLLTVTFCILIIFNTACVKEEGGQKIKIGLVTGTGLLNDKGFNQQAYEGMLLADSKVDRLECEVMESATNEQLVANIDYFVKKGMDVIITLGFDAAGPTMKAAKDNPAIKFLLFDYSFPYLPGNMATVVFQVDEASFPCGFLAAWWATVRNPAKPSVGYVAGPDIPTIRQFTTSFISGVNYYNLQYGKSVSVSGANSQSFADAQEGSRLAESLINNGSEVIFACAGETGNGALSKARSVNKTAIGVDTDQYLSFPHVGNILLTSCMKRLDEAVYSEIISITEGTFRGGQTLVYNLKNKGVDIAPYHDFEQLVPDNIKQAVLNIKQGIIQGTIKTGW